MDRDGVEVEEDRPAKVKSAPALPTENESEEHEVTHATFRSWCEACVAGRATEDALKRSHNESSVGHGLRFPRSQHRTWPRSWCWCRDAMAQWELAKYFAKDLSPMPSTACWPSSTRGVWPKCCSRQTMSLPFRHLSMAKLGERTVVEKTRSTRPSRTEQPRTQCGGSRVSPGPMLLQEKLGYKVDSNSIMRCQPARRGGVFRWRVL